MTRRKGSAHLRRVAAAPRRLALLHDSQQQGTSRGAGNNRAAPTCEEPPECRLGRPFSTWHPPLRSCSALRLPQPPPPPPPPALPGCKGPARQALAPAAGCGNPFRLLLTPRRDPTPCPAPLRVPPPPEPGSRDPRVGPPQCPPGPGCRELQTSGPPGLSRRAPP